AGRYVDGDEILGRPCLVGALGERDLRRVNAGHDAVARAPDPVIVRAPRVGDDPGAGQAADAGPEPVAEAVPPVAAVGLIALHAVARPHVLIAVARHPPGVAGATRDAHAGRTCRVEVAERAGGERGRPADSLRVDHRGGGPALLWQRQIGFRPAGGAVDVV